MENPDDRSKLSDGNDGPVRKRFKKFVTKEHSDIGFKSLHAMRHEQQFCDIELEVDGLVISAHKLVLAATIPYFRAMFSSE